jgi:ATP-binding cassette subfamily C exporter for protease/lipase
LVKAVMELKAHGKTVVLITHRTSIIGVVDRILFLRDGALQAYGPRQEVLEALRRAQAQHAANPPAPAQVQPVGPAL